MKSNIIPISFVHPRAFHDTLEILKKEDGRLYEKMLRMINDMHKQARKDN